MQRVVKKTIATAMAGTMILTGLPQGFGSTVQAAEKEDVSFVYDDGYVDTEGFFFMQGGSFCGDVGGGYVENGSPSTSYADVNDSPSTTGQEVDKDAVLVLMDKYGNKTEIPSTDADGNRNFTQAWKATSGTYYSMVKLKNDKRIAFVRTDGTYFGGDGTYYTYDEDEIAPLCDYAILAHYETGEGDDITWHSKVITDTGKTIDFDGYYVYTKSVGNNLLCYTENYNSDSKTYEYTIYGYDTEKDEIIKIEGEPANLYNSTDYFAVREKDSYIVDFYNASFEKTNVSVSLADGYIRAYSDRYAVISNWDSHNIMDKTGELWNNTGKKFRDIEALDTEKGYYYADVLNDDNTSEWHILSKDNSIDVNILDEILKLSQNDGSSHYYDVNAGYSSTTGGIYSYSNIYSFNGDVVVYVEEGYHEQGSVYVFSEESNYTDVRKLDDAGYIAFSNDEYLLTADYNTNDRLVVKNIYDTQYQIMELQTEDALEFSNKYVSSAIWPFILNTSYSKRVENENGISSWLYVSSNYLMINQDGTINNEYGTIKLTLSGDWICNNDEKTDIYNSEGTLIYSGSYLGRAERNNEAIWRYLDDSVCVFKDSYYNAQNYIVCDHEGAIYFTNEDYGLYDYSMSEDGIFMACVYETDSDGNRKYGAKYINEKTLTSDTGVSVEYTIGQLDSNVSLDVKTLSADDAETKKISFDGQIKDTTVQPEAVTYVAYEISLTDKENQKVQPDGKVTVKIPCPEGYNGEKCYVYYVNDEGQFVNMKAVYEDGYLSFETNHFSTYLVTETELIAIFEALFGDVNGDGQVSLTDSALIRRFIAGWDVTIDTSTADVNGDGQVSLTDSALIRRFIAGWDVTLGVA